MNADPQRRPTAQLTCVAALYRFTAIDDPAKLRAPLLQALNAGGLTGTLLLAREGVNGTLAGREAEIDQLIAWLCGQLGCATDHRLLNVKKSWHQQSPFLRRKVKLKREIVTLGQPAVDAAQHAGTYVRPADWNALISDPEVVTIDTRNRYEVGVGRFRGAVNPETDTFREFPAYAQRELDPQQHPKLAMYCTGGIRCEKATAYMKQLGFAEVYHLQGGILQYLEDVPAEESLWEGECFVFDDRVTVDHSLQAGSYTQCHACRTPLAPADRDDPHYQPGVQCRHCYQDTSQSRQAGFAERQRQVELAKERGEAHFGAAAAADRERRAAAKRERKNTQRRGARDA